MSRKDYEHIEAQGLVALEFIRTTVAKRGYPPSRREITEAIGCVSTSSGQRIVDHLVRQGVIEVDPSIPRGIRVTSNVCAKLLVTTDSDPATVDAAPDRDQEVSPDAR